MEMQPPLEIEAESFEHSALYYTYIDWLERVKDMDMAAAANYEYITHFDSNATCESIEIIFY